MNVQQEEITSSLYERRIQKHRAMNT